MRGGDNERRGDPHDEKIVGAVLCLLAGPTIIGVSLIALLMVYTP